MCADQTRVCWCQEAQEAHLSVSRATQPWFGLPAKLFLLKARFSSSGCRKNFLATSITRSTCTNTRVVRFCPRAERCCAPCCPHLLLRDPGVLQKHQPDLCERSVQLPAQTAHLLLANTRLSQAVRAEVHHRDAHFTAWRSSMEDLSNYQEFHKVFPVHVSSLGRHVICPSNRKRDPNDRQ